MKLKLIAPLILSIALSLLAPAAQAQDWAKSKLEKSPRHLEWVNVKRGERNLKCFIAYPESKTKTTAVLVIHEIFGLSDWVREVCDELAANGYIAIAPDLLSGKEGEDTTSYKSVDDVRKAVSSLPADQIELDLKEVEKYVSHVPSANGKMAVTGFCWGGTQTWLAMSTNPHLKLGLTFYGKANPDLDLKKITGPVYGFYGENDARVTSTVEDTKKRMLEAKRDFYPEIYPGAGHGFMRSGEEPGAEEPNIKARKEAWTRILDLLKKL